VTEEYVPIRLSHLLRHCSVGAIVRGSEDLMVVEDIRSWNRNSDIPQDQKIHYVDQVRSALGIEAVLCKPPVARESDDGKIIEWIPAVRFPSWMRCPKCGLLYPRPWRHEAHEDNSHWRLCAAKGTGGSGRERECRGALEQAPWVMVHEDGYLADVPWHDLAHADHRNEAKRKCSYGWPHPYLKLIARNFRNQVQCTRCQAEGSLPSRFRFPKSTWQQPWIHKPPTNPPDDTLAWILEINDVRVHAASNRTALVIPPESRIRRGTVEDRLYGSSRNQRAIRHAKTKVAKNSAINRIAREYRCTPDKLEEAVRKIDAGYPLYGQKITGGDLLVSEYKALTGIIPDLSEDEDFVTEHYTDDWQLLSQKLGDGTESRIAASVSHLVAVNKLKEIMVFDGFRRAGSERLVPPDITGESGWLPAMELYGEGIFFALNEKLLQRWEGSHVLRSRADDFEKRCDRSSLRVAFDINISPRFLLCHTLAHVMIRQLDAQAGYSAASLTERIYCGTAQNPMAGILIYVAVADEEGSLGGLMELARPDRFLRLLVSSFEAANWCSLDPVCSRQEGHGPDLLNRAACHACALVPETSCVYGNVLLDRVFVTGDTEAGIPAFLDCAEEQY